MARKGTPEGDRSADPARRSLVDLRSSCAARSTSSVIFEILTVILAIGFFLFLQLLHLDNTDLTEMEALGDPYMGVRLLHILKENSFWRLLVEGSLPCQREYVHGTLGAYLFLPFYSLFGPNWWLFKTWPLLFAVPTLLLTYLLGRDLHSRFAGLAALFLFALHPSYLAGMRLGGFLWSHMQFFSTAALYFLFRWGSTNRTGYYVLGLFLLGMGLGTQMWFNWFVVGLAAVAALYGREIFEQVGTRSGGGRLGFVLLGAAGLLSGAALIVYREIVHPFRSLHALWRGSSSVAGSYFQKMIETLGVINRNFSSVKETFDHNETAQSWFPSIAGNEFFPIALWLAVVFLFARGLFGRRKRLLVFPIILCVMVLLVTVSYAKIDMTSTFFLYPFPQLVLAVALAEAWNLLAGRKSRQVVLALFVALVGFKEIRGVKTFAESLDDFNPEFYNSRVVYDLADWFGSNDPSGKVVVCSGVYARNYALLADMLSHHLPGFRVRSLYLDEGESVADFSFSLPDRPVTSDLTMLFTTPPSVDDSGRWPTAVREWIRAARRSAPVARFESPPGNGVCEVYPIGQPPGEPVAEVLLNWESKEEIRRGKGIRFGHP